MVARQPEAFGAAPGKSMDELRTRLAEHPADGVAVHLKRRRLFLLHADQMVRDPWKSEIDAPDDQSRFSIVSR